MAKCLVTGGAGFIGSWVTDYLVEENHEVIVIDNLSTGKIDNVNKAAKFIESDIRNYDTLAKAAEGCEYIFHLASLARIQPSIIDPLESNYVNLTGSLYVFNIARKNGAKVIFSSSSSLYDGSILPTDEEAPIQAKNPYTVQKWAAEKYLELFEELYELEYCILRYFNVFGERQILDGDYAAVVGIFLDQKQRGLPITLHGDGEQRRDFTYVKDVAKANLMAMDWQGVFNIGTSQNYSIKQIADAIDPDGERERKPQPEGEVRHTLANNSKALTAGWRPSTDLMEWLSEF